VSGILERVQKVVDVLAADAVDVDRTGVVPGSHWQLLADEGLYGLAAPAEAGGPGLQFPEIVDVLERMSGACLATAFTWVQHHGAVLSLAMSQNIALRDELLADAVAGRTRCGVAFAGVVPDVPRMRATRVDGGWQLTGHAPFVSGWGVIDALQVSARDVESDDVVAGIIEAHAQPGITAVEPLELVAADASRTVSLTVDGLVVPDERVVSRVPRPAFQANQVFGSRINGTLPIGLARRCAQLLDEGGQADAAARVLAECDAVRARLDAGLGDMALLLQARADGAELAVRAASALVVAGGGPSLLRGAQAQLLARNAVFTLVAASRPELKQLLLQRFAA
jgi:alkylation response protein AidB-like acyl-CoA dehydrogenase